MGIKRLRSGLPGWRHLLAIGVALGGPIFQGLGQVPLAKAASPQPSRPPARPTASTPITDRECEAFGRQLENRFAEGDKTLFTRTFDCERMLSRQQAGDLQNPSATRASSPATASPKVASVAATARPTPGPSGIAADKNVRAPGSPGQQQRVDPGQYNKELVSVLNAKLGQMQSLKYLRFTRQNDEPRLLLRLMPKAGGCLYLEPILGRDRNGQIRIADVFNYSTSENMSQTVSRLGLYPFLARQKDLPERLFGKQPEFVKGISRKDSAKTLESVEQLDKAIGGDAYLDYLRAELLYKMGDTAKANEAANRAIEREPDLVEPYFFMLGCLVHERQNAAAIALLDRLRTGSKLPREDLAKIVEAEKGYAGLVASAEYRNWRSGAVANFAGTQTVAQQPNKASARPAAKPGLKLQAVFYKTAGAGATISGQYVEVGDRVQGHKVLAIGPQSVTLQAPDGGKKVCTLADSGD